MSVHAIMILHTDSDVGGIFSRPGEQHLGVNMYIGMPVSSLNIMLTPRQIMVVRIEITSGIQNS